MLHPTSLDAKMHRPHEGRLGGEEYGDEDFVDEHLLRRGSAREGHEMARRVPRVPGDEDDEDTSVVSAHQVRQLDPWHQAGSEDSDDEREAALRRQQDVSDEDESSGDRRRRAYFAAQGPQTAGEVYLQHALA